MQRSADRQDVRARREAGGAPPSPETLEARLQRFKRLRDRAGDPDDVRLLDEAIRQAEEAAEAMWRR